MPEKTVKVGGTEYRIVENPEGGRSSDTWEMRFPDGSWLTLFPHDLWANVLTALYEAEQGRAELMKTADIIDERNQKLIEQNAKLVECVRWYANPELYKEHDSGIGMLPPPANERKAAETLKEIKGEGSS